jgi:8-oxo-dGTP pyrophosphatase MutT (NUDIX family)
VKKFLIRYIYQASRMFWLAVKPLSVGVRLMMIREGQVLMVKHVYEKYWYMPGGAVERGETLEAAVRRESAEEVGATLNELRLFGTYTNFENGKSDHVVVFLSQDFDLTGQSDDEIECFAFYPLEHLPEPLSPGSENRIREYLDGQIGIYGTW